MQLPIDGRKAPFRSKYITEETPMLNNWMVFGSHDDGTVDVSDANGDIFVHVSPEVAEKIIAARDRFCAEIESLLCLAG